MLRQLARQALTPLGLAISDREQLEAERRRTEQLAASLAHERLKVLKLKQRLAARDDEIRELSSPGPLAELERKLEATEQRLAEEMATSRRFRKQLLWHWGRYPGTSKVWKREVADDPFTDRSRDLKARLVDALAAPEFPPTDERVTVVVTSCARHDLLARTLASFFWANTYPIEKVIVVEDGDLELSDARKSAFAGQPIEWINTGGPVGQILAIDHAYSRVSTPYIFHVEDDYDFVAPGFIERSMTILRAEPLCLQVWIRDPPGPGSHPFEDDILETAGVTWRRVAKDFHAFWHGFSFNPGLRRLREYRLLGSAFAKIVEPGRGFGGRAEAQLSTIYRDVGYFAAALWEDGGKPFALHTGGSRHVD